MTPAPGVRPVKSAERTLAVIEFVASHDRVSFSHIMEALQLPRSSTHALLATLVSCGWLRRDPVSATYAIGLRAWQVGQTYTGHHHLVATAKPVMDALARETGETVQLSRLDGVENVYIAISESTKPIRLVTSVGMRLSAPATALGKAMLSSIDLAVAETLLRAARLERYTPNTIIDVDEILATLRTVRQVGYAIDNEEFTPDCRCVAVPLTAESDFGITSAISITMLASRTDDSWPAGVSQPLSAAADEIRRALGASHPHTPFRV